MKHLYSILFLSFLFLFLLFFPSQALDASKTGLLLWFDALLPTLLPFLVLSQAILKTPLIDLIQKIFGPIFQKIFHCSYAGAFCIVCGFLCGYPVGARLIAAQLKDHKMSLEEGQFLLSFCNNVSPMFCISYGIMKGIGTNRLLPYLLIIYLSPVIWGYFTRPAKPYLNAAQTKKQTSSADPVFQLIDVCIIDSFLVLIKLCGYLILFSLFTKALFLLFPWNSLSITAMLSAALEITGGLSQISKLPLGTLRTALAVCGLSFGGFCCIFQIHSVVSETELNLKTYLLHKVLIMLLALFLFWSFRFCSSFFPVNGWSQFLTVFCDHFIVTI